MGIFDVFKKKSADNAQNQTPQANQPAAKAPELNHRRYHVRYDINNRPLFQIKHPQLGAFNVVDLSHHGALIESVNGTSLDACTIPTNIELNMCGSVLTIELAQCQKRKSGWGLVFKHVSEGTIRAVGNLIEPLRCGSTAVAIASDPAKDGVMSRFRKRFQGDGPFDLVYEVDESGNVAFIMATIRRGQEYGSVIWDKGNVVTKKSIDNRGDGARMSQTIEIDHELVWLGAAACLGLKFSEGAVAAETLTQWLMGQNQTQYLKIG